MEESLCDICTEHPRFYNEYGDVFEAGLGMCCEEAARLLLKGTKSVELIAEADGEEDTALPPILILREKVFDCLKRTDISFAEKERCALALVNAVPEKFRAGEAARFCLTLERMEDAWGDMLRDMENRGESAEVFINTDAVRAERICEYFVFRHFAALSEAKDASVGLKFCFFAVYVVSCLEALGYGDEALRLFSAEIEYSDENVDRISEYLGRNKNV